jgi:hypothetical protein
VISAARIIAYDASSIDSTPLGSSRARSHRSVPPVPAGYDLLSSRMVVQYTTPQLAVHLLVISL